MRKKLALIGAVLAAALSWIVVSASTSGATPVPTACSGLYSNASFTSITDPANSACDISNSTVTGAVVSPDLGEALDRDPAARKRFDGLSYSQQRAHVLSVEGAKTTETRARRIAQAVSALR